MKPTKANDGARAPPQGAPGSINNPVPEIPLHEQRSSEVNHGTLENTHETLAQTQKFD